MVLKFFLEINYRYIISHKVFFPLVTDVFLVFLILLCILVLCWYWYYCKSTCCIWLCFGVMDETFLWCATLWGGSISRCFFYYYLIWALIFDWWIFASLSFNLLCLQSNALINVFTIAMLSFDKSSLYLHVTWMHRSL